MSKEQEDFLIFLEEFIKKTRENRPKHIDADKLEKVEKTLRAIGNGIVPLIDDIEPGIVGASLLYFGAVLMKGCIETEDPESDVIEEVTGLRI